MPPHYPTPHDDETAEAVALRGVGKTFANGTVALEGVDLAVERGEFLSVLGPSGCGKSTLLRLIAGLEAPTQGRIARDASPAGDSISYVFQDPTLLPWASVSDNVYFPLRLRGVPKVRAASDVEEALNRVGLAAAARAMPAELSGGMKMRVSIARALVTRPRLLLMDEPFAALDEITRFALNDDLLSLWRDDRCTIVFVTHSVFESVYLSDRIVVMSARPGRVSSEIAIDAARPRDEAFRTSAAYAALCRTTSAALHAAMEAG